MSVSLRRLFLIAALAAPAFVAWTHASAAPQDAVEVKGQIDENDANDPVQRRPAKTYQVKLQKGKTYQIDLVSTDFDSYLRLVDGAGKQVAQDDDSGGNLNARIRYTALDDDTFTVYCSTLNGALGNFTLTVQGPGAAIVGGGKVAVGKATGEVVLDVGGMIGADDAPDPVRRNPCKIHEVKLKKGVAYQIDLMSKDFDSYLRLEDDGGRELAKDDDGGGGRNARIRFAPDMDGTFKVYATTFGGGAGNYKLIVRSGGGGGAAPGGAIALAAPTADKASEHQGRYKEGDPVDKGRGRLCKIFAVELKANKTYVIDLMSDDLDSFLRLEGPTGNRLAEDDDGGEGLNSRIVFQCPADGRYRLVATTFAGSAEGAFTLRVAEQ